MSISRGLNRCSRIRKRVSNVETFDYKFVIESLPYLYPLFWDEAMKAKDQINQMIQTRKILFGKWNKIHLQNRIKWDLIKVEIDKPATPVSRMVDEDEGIGTPFSQASTLKMNEVESSNRIPCSQTSDYFSGRECTQPENGPPGCRY